MLVETESEILGYDGIFGITETEWEVQKEREASATKQEALEQQSAEKIDETLLLRGESGRFAIYQMDSGDEHTYQLWEWNPQRVWAIPLTERITGWFMQHRGCQRSH